MKILGIDTSSTMFSVCLNVDEKVLYELRCERSFYKESRDAGFFKTLKHLIDNLDNTSLDAIALSLGPGMFTSLRVGLAFAKGLYLSQHIPIYAVNTLEVIAKSFPFFAFKKNSKIIVAAVINAFQNEIYVAFYNYQQRIGKDLLITVDGFVDHTNNNFKPQYTIFVIGPGVQFIKQNKTAMKFIKKSKPLIMLDSELYFPSAARLIKTAMPRIRKGEYDNPDILEPHYIKKTSAEKKVDK